MRVLLIAAAAVFLVAAAPVMAPGTEADRAPDWLVRPDGERIARFYPKRAWREDVEGQATITCTVSTDTRLRDCAVVSEAPTGYGFGDAALKLSEEMRMAPAIRQGLPAESLVRVPLVFKLPQTEPFQPPPPGILLALAGGFLALAVLLIGMLVAAYRAFGRR